MQTPSPALTSGAGAPKMVTKLDSEACEIGVALFVVVFFFSK